MNSDLPEFLREMFAGLPDGGLSPANKKRKRHNETNYIEDVFHTAVQDMHILNPEQFAGSMLLEVVSLLLEPDDLHTGL